MDKAKTRVLLVDDDEEDFLVTRDLFSEMEESRFSLDWVSSFEAGQEKIESQEYDVYLLDYRLGARTGLELLEEARQKGCPAPMILLTGQGDHEVDLKAMESGADDYLVKGRVEAPLLERSIRYAMEKARNLEAQRELQRNLAVRICELEEALSRIKRLHGLLPICSYCKRVRDDKNYWQEVESYIADHSEVEFTHGFCPECFDKYLKEDLQEAENQSGAGD